MDNDVPVFDSPTRLHASVDFLALVGKKKRGGPHSGLGRGVMDGQQRGPGTLSLTSYMLLFPSYMYLLGYSCHAGGDIGGCDLALLGFVLERRTRTDNT